MKKIISLLAVFSFLCNFSFAQQSGMLDPAFDFDGRVVTMFTDEARAFAVEVQADGKIVAGGFRIASGHADFVLCRYNNDGSLDQTFGNGGIAITDILPGKNDCIRDLKIQNDGKIVVAGDGGYPGVTRILAARFNSNGTLDTGFGNNGVIDLISMADSYESAFALDSLNRIFIGGCEPGTGWYRPVILCFDSTGTPDSTFGINGIIKDYDFIGSVEDIIPTESGLISCVSSMSFIIAKYHYSGSRDTSFGTNGYVTDDFGSNQWAASTQCALQPDGKIIASGWVDYTHLGNGEDFVLARYTADGVLDSTFGTVGYVVYPVALRDVLTAMQLLPDGKILASGFVEFNANVPGYNFSLLKLNPDGSRDVSFGSNGLVTTDFGSYADISFGMTIQNDSAIVVCGQTYLGNRLSFALARYKDAALTGVNENHNHNNDLLIYPVPVVDGKINFSTALNDATINIYDVSGRAVFHADDFSGTTLNVKSVFAKGVYNIQVVSEKISGALLFTVTE